LQLWIVETALCWWEQRLEAVFPTYFHNLGTRCRLYTFRKSEYSTAAAELSRERPCPRLDRG
jgi:hypothetical protein